MALSFPSYRNIKEDDLKCYFRLLIIHKNSFFSYSSQILKLSLIHYNALVKNECLSRDEIFCLKYFRLNDSDGRTSKIYHKDLEKQGDLGDCFVTVTPLLHVAQWVSRAPPHHTLSAFLNLNSILHLLLKLSENWIFIINKWVLSENC